MCNGIVLLLLFLLLCGWNNVCTVVAVSLISPLELVRTKLQTETMSYNEVLSALRRDIRSTGWRTLTLGLGPSLLRDVPFSGKFCMITWTEKCLWGIILVQQFCSWTEDFYECVNKVFAVTEIVSVWISVNLYKYALSLDMTYSLLGLRV